MFIKFLYELVPDEYVGSGLVIEFVFLRKNLGLQRGQ